MKKIGEYTARGSLDEEEIERITLFDGTFTTAYRVVGFDVWGATWNNSTNPDVIGKLSKNPDGVNAEVNFMRADDDNQIAWAGMQGQDESGSQHFSIIDPDNLIVEDLYVYALTAGNQKINYLVRMEKYEITDWQGALSMARDRAQGDL